MIVGIVPGASHGGPSTPGRQSPALSSKIPMLRSRSPSTPSRGRSRSMSPGLRDRDHGDQPSLSTSPQREISSVSSPYRGGEQRRYDVALTGQHRHARGDRGRSLPPTPGTVKVHRETQGNHQNDEQTIESPEPGVQPLWQDTDSPGDGNNSLDQSSEVDRFEQSLPAIPVLSSLGGQVWKSGIDMLPKLRHSASSHKYKLTNGTSTRSGSSRNQPIRATADALDTQNR